jgi:hypothetical protein
MPQKFITPKDRDALIKARVEQSLGSLIPSIAAEAVDAQLQEDGIKVVEAVEPE